MLKGLKSLFRESLEERKKQPRGGYFLIFFALLLTILTLPLLGTVLTETIDVRGSISRFQDASFIRGRGDSLLNTVLRTNAAHGLGYYKKHFYPESVGEGELQVNYFFSSASVIPVPTAKYGIEDFGPSATCEDADGAGTPDDPDYNADSYECDELSVLDGRISRDATSGSRSALSYYYTSPALGTGTAGDECEFHKLNLTKIYPGDSQVDPLDDPCNWNVLALGETVAIPLYTRSPKNPDQIIIRTPETLKLRVRFPCADGAEVCDPSERQVISWDEDGDGVEDFTASNLREDNTPRVMNWVIKSESTFTPNTNWFSDEENRSDRNSELTVNRLRLITGDPFERFKYLDVDSFSMIDLLRVPVSDITFAFQRFGAFPSLEDYFSLLTSYLSPDFSNEGGAFLSEGGEFIDGAYVGGGDDFAGPVLILQFIDGIFTDTDGENVNRLEYQIVSDVTIGNDKFIVVGYSEDDDASYALTQQSVDGPEEEAAGVVFGN